MGIFRNVLVPFIYGIAISTSYLVCINPNHPWHRYIKNERTLEDEVERNIEKPIENHRLKELMTLKRGFKELGISAEDQKHTIIDLQPEQIKGY